MSNATGPQSLSRLLGDAPALRRLICDARNKAQAGQQAVLTLPPALSEHSQIQILPDRVLLLARNNSVAQLLRFHGPRLAKAAGVPEFQVRVQPDAFGDAPRRASPHEPVLSPDVAPILEGLATGVDHAPLSTALRRLAALARKT